MIAAQYPPMKGSSGLQRVLKFSQYLPANGWLPIVLTLNPAAHELVSDEQLGDIPGDVLVKRSFGLDASRHLSFRGKYPTFLALPDRWASWWLSGVPMGMSLMRRYRPRLIWSTFPIPTAHRIGHTLAAWSGKPWVADFRDSMTEPGYPMHPTIRKSVLKIERKTVARAERCVFTAPSALRMYAERYPDLPVSKWTVIENGYDEGSFASLDHDPPLVAKGRIVLVHSGLVDPVDRDPTNFFEAIRLLRARGEVSGDRFRVVLRATGFNDLYRQQVEKLKIQDIVDLCEAVPYSEALAEMEAASGLILFQGSGCNHQIPAKAYEYFRAGKPIIGLTDPNGDTGQLLHSVGIESIARLENLTEIVSVLSDFLRKIRSREIKGVDLADALPFSREKLTVKLAALFDSITDR